MATKNESVKYKHAERAAWRQVDKEAVILDLESSEYFSLNEVGVVIWEKVGEGADLDAIVEAVCAEFDVDEAKAKKDATTLIGDLVKKKLLEVRK
ncbi:MAG TPA: PqqD family protein [Elusimicrobiota bacterium]|nr:PqqD family protein [Elusimicrobiota bacterium]